MVSATNSPAGVDVSTPRSNSTRRQPRELARSSSRAKVRDGPAHPVELRGDQHVGFTSVESVECVGQRGAAHVLPGEPGVGDDLQRPPPHPQ